MKKILLIVCLMMFSALGANASTTVYFQNTGVPLYVQRGAGPMISTQALRNNAAMRADFYRHSYARPYRHGNRFARDRFAQPRCGARAGMPPGAPGNRMTMETRPAEYNPPASRFEKTNKPRVQRSYSRNGMVYYN